jgi:hypothetical protein
MKLPAKTIYDEAKDWLRVAGIPLVIALGGWWVTTWIESVRQAEQEQARQREQQEQKTRLYAELMSRREEADSALRKDMFGKVFDKFFAESREDPREQVLKLEILAKNFHEALDLSPLFKQVLEQLRTAPKIAPADRARYEQRLIRLARDIGSKQALALEQSGGKIGVYVDLRCYSKRTGDISIYPPERVPDPSDCKPVTRDDEKRTPGVKLPHRGGAAGSCGPNEPSTADATCVDFALWLAGFNPERSELLLRLEASPRPVKGQSDDAPIRTTFGAVTTFHASYFDFPLLDYTRLPNGWRVAVVLQEFEPSTGVALLNLVYFPASRASLKDKPYFDEMLDQLLRAQASEAGRTTEGGLSSKR